MRITKPNVVLMATLVLATSCANESNASNKGRSSDPTFDAQLAVSRKDFHLIGLSGYAPYVPGVDADFEELKQHYKIVVDDKTSDVIEGNNQKKKQIEKYAATYNKYIMEGMGCSLIKPLEPCSQKPK